MKRNPKFKVGQVVCITGLEPNAYARLVSYDEDSEQWNTTEGYYNAEEMRPLTKREHAA